MRRRQLRRQLSMVATRQLAGKRRRQLRRQLAMVATGQLTGMRRWRLRCQLSTRQPTGMRRRRLRRQLSTRQLTGMRRRLLRRQLSMVAARQPTGMLTRQLAKAARERLRVFLAPLMTVRHVAMAQVPLRSRHEAGTATWPVQRRHLAPRHPPSTRLRRVFSMTGSPAAEWVSPRPPLMPRQLPTQLGTLTWQTLPCPFRSPLSLRKRKRGLGRHPPRRQLAFQKTRGLRLRLMWPPRHLPRRQLAL